MATDEARRRDAHRRGAAGPRAAPTVTSMEARRVGLLALASELAVLGLALAGLLVALTCHDQEPDPFRRYTIASTSVLTCVAAVLGEAIRRIRHLPSETYPAAFGRRHPALIEVEGNVSEESHSSKEKLLKARGDQSPPLQPAQLEEMHKQARRTLVRNEFALRLRLAKRMHTLEAKAREAEAIEAKLNEVQLAYDALANLFHQRVLSLGDLDTEASNQLGFDMRESMLTPPAPVIIPNEIEGDPPIVFKRAFEDAKKSLLEQKACSHIPTDHTSWQAASHAARHILDPDYSLKAFYTDVRLAFPELALYMSRRAQAVAGGKDVTSGISPADEYRRTVGALFHVYWLSRIEIDGKNGFSFGVDDDWKPLREPPPEADEVPEIKKRREFYEKQEWEGITQLLMDSKILERGADGVLVVCEERMLAMLSLTAIHDLMKVEALLPRVAEEHAPYNGFRGGDIINDHDAALGYVLDHYPQCLPSYIGLPEKQQRTVRFTQSKMSFNHGWLVQAEAPPEALFSKFKMVADEGHAEPSDIAFYFVHWLTDLAGAVPTPLEGSEKFVLQFPRPVLGSFIKSFGVLNELAVKTETQVFEHFLYDWWAENEARLGLAPEGAHSIALMRLVVQVQSEKAQLAVISAFAALHPDDKTVLCEEMANSGIDGQIYSRCPTKNKGGPAILVYYSPAFLRTLVADQPVAALKLLAEIYRRARHLWPATPGLNGSVTVRIDQVKELKLSEIQSVYAFGDTWALTRRNDLEAVLERIPVDVLAERPTEKTKVLKFWRSAVTMRDQLASTSQLSNGGDSNSTSRYSPSGRGTPSNMSAGTSVRDWV